MKRIVVNLLLVLVSFAVAGLIAEAIVRCTIKDTIPLFPRYHTDYHYGPYTLRGLRRSADFWHTSVDGHWRFTTNSRGQRATHDYPYTKTANTLRVLVLGDSHTQGYEVAQDATYSAVLERYLIQHGHHAEVINTGVSGFSTAEELALLENEGIKYQPDVVVVGLFENDFDDNFKSALFKLDSDGNLAAEKYSHIPGVKIQNLIYAIPGVCWLSEHSYFYSLMFNTVWNVGKLILMRTAAHASHSDEVETPTFEYAVATQDNVTPAQSELMRALLLRMRKFCEKRGIRLIVADIPGYPGPWHYRSSIPLQLRDQLTNDGFEILDSRVLFSDWDGVAALHVPHGYNHISALAHSMIGINLGQRISSSAASR